MVDLTPLRRHLLQAVLTTVALTACGEGQDSAPSEVSETGTEIDSDSDPGSETESAPPEPQCDYSLADGRVELHGDSWEWPEEFFVCADDGGSDCPVLVVDTAAGWVETTVGLDPGIFEDRYVEVHPTCGPDEGTPGECCYTFELEPIIAVGRPFVAEGRARTAQASAGQGWGACSGSLHEALRALPPAHRAELAACWTRTALVEHASIASFTVFTLDLLQLGAPAELLLAATEAAGDEVRHAADAFAIASSLAGEDRGPGPLDTRGVAPHPTLREAALAAFREGCINETLAAAIAAESGRRAAHPELAALLNGVADDEARHAALAWRFVAWACRSEPTLITELADVLTTFEAELVPALTGPSEPCAAWGVLTAPIEAEVARRALREVVWPCLQAMMGEVA